MRKPSLSKMTPEQLRVAYAAALEKARAVRIESIVRPNADAQKRLRQAWTEVDNIWTYLRKS